VPRHFTVVSGTGASIDWSIQQTCASWVAKHDRRRLDEVHPNVFAGDVRQSAIFLYHGQPMYPRSPGMGCTVTPAAVRN
jgi:hypothetical protein